MVAAMVKAGEEKTGQYLQGIHHRPERAGERQQDMGRDQSWELNTDRCWSTHINNFKQMNHTAWIHKYFCFACILKEGRIAATWYYTEDIRGKDPKQPQQVPPSHWGNDRIQRIVKAQGKVRKSPQKHSMAADGLLGLHHLVKRRPISLSPLNCMIL